MQTNETIFEDKYSLIEISEQNVKIVHEMCERNADYYPMPLEFFIRGTLGDSGYIPDLCVVICQKSDTECRTPIGYFHLNKRKGWVIGTRIYIKSFIIDKNYRRKGIGSWALSVLMKRAKTRFPRSTIHFGACNPDYWFPGIDTRHTAALFFLKKLGFKQHGVVQSLTVKLDQFSEQEPISERNGYTFARATSEDLESVKTYVKKNFFGTWHLEAAIGFQNNPITTFIAKNPQGEIIGFATHSALWPSSFGPIGVTKTIRGQRLGDILLRWTMWDMKRMGYPTSTIMWVVGEVPKFYCKTINAFIHPVYYSLKRWL